MRFVLLGGPYLDYLLLRCWDLREYGVGTVCLHETLQLGEILRKNQGRAGILQNSMEDLLPRWSSEGGEAG